MNSQEMKHELPHHLKPRSLEARITTRSPRKGFHHACRENFLRLKETDELDLLTSNDYYAFCFNNINITCRAPAHDRCWERGYCVKNPLETDYHDYMAGGRFYTKGIYLNRRIQGKTNGW